MALMAAPTTGAGLYDRTAARTSRVVLRGYSTSFGLGARLLGTRARGDIEAVYALVRIADEIVDTLRGDTAADLLDELEGQVAQALVSGWSTNLVVHSFARTARRVGIGHDVIDPFFASMRMDLTVRVHDEESYRRYVHGSAEVVGLMCLAVFLNADRRPGEPLRQAPPDVVAGAQALGAAFQKVNFLRDLAEDSAGLGRSYFPGVSAATLDAETLAVLLAEIEQDAATARAALPHLPRRARIAVAATLGLYDRLATELAATPPEELLRRRVRVGTPAKVAVLVRSVVAETLPGTWASTSARTSAGVARAARVPAVRG
jgi:phytoene/squalene synthetase